MKAYNEAGSEKVLMNLVNSNGSWERKEYLPGIFRRLQLIHPQI